MGVRNLKKYWNTAVALVIKMLDALIYYLLATIAM